MIFTSKTKDTIGIIITFSSIILAQFFKRILNESFISNLFIIPLIISVTYLMYTRYNGANKIGKNRMTKRIVVIFGILIILILLSTLFFLLKSQMSF